MLNKMILGGWALTYSVLAESTGEALDDAALDLQCRSIASSSLTLWDITSLETQEGKDFYEADVGDGELNIWEALRWNYCDKLGDSEVYF